MKSITRSLAIASLLSVTWLSAHAAPASVRTSSENLVSTLQLADAHEMWTRGKVVRVSVARGKVTIEHEPIKNLKMMGMTMSFTVEDSALLEDLEAGDIIEFVADMNGNELILKNLRKPKS